MWNCSDQELSFVAVLSSIQYFTKSEFNEIKDACNTDHALKLLSQEVNQIGQHGRLYKLRAIFSYLRQVITFVPEEGIKMLDKGVLGNIAMLFKKEFDENIIDFVEASLLLKELTMHHKEKVKSTMVKDPTFVEGSTCSFIK